MSIPKIKAIIPLQEWKLLVTFVNGIQKLYDCIPLLHLEPFRLLSNEAFFKSIKIDVGGYGISWNDDIDLGDYELWHNGVEVETEALSLAELLYPS